MKIALVSSQSEAHHFFMYSIIIEGKGTCNDLASPPGGDAGVGEEGWVLILLVVSYYRNWDTLQLDRALGSNLN